MSEGRSLALGSLGKFGDGIWWGVVEGTWLLLVSGGLDYLCCLCFLCLSWKGMGGDVNELEIDSCCEQGAGANSGSRLMVLCWLFERENVWDNSCLCFFLAVFLD